MRTLASILALALLAACDTSPETVATDLGNKVADIAGDNMIETLNTTAADAIDGLTAVPTDKWIGKWVGVEGLALDIAHGEKPATYRLKVALMDSTNSYDGVANGDTIAFNRDGKPAVIRHVTGDETGLKWLGGKKDCLMIDKGEGFCRR